MQLYEVMRSLAFLRSLPEVEPYNITIIGRPNPGFTSVCGPHERRRFKGIVGFLLALIGWGRHIWESCAIPTL